MEHDLSSSVLNGHEMSEIVAKKTREMEVAIVIKEDEGMDK